MGTIPSSPPEQGTMRSASRRFRSRSSLALVVVIGAIVSTLSLGMFAEPASAQGTCPEHGCVDVIAVDGLIDEIVADFISQSVRRAEDSGDVVAVVLQMDSLGTAISTQELNKLATLITESPVPVSVWVGASGSRALGGSAELAMVAKASGIAPGARIGEIGEQRLDPSRFGDLLQPEGKDVDRSVLTESFKGEDAVKAGLIDRFAPTLVDHVGHLDSVDSRTVTKDGEKQLQPVQRVRLSKLSLPIQIMHTAASPSVAYLLLVIGAGLLLFEFFTAGVGVAGVVGAGFLLLGGYGLAALPFRGWALALFVLSFVACGIDMQTGLARIWSVMGFAAFLVASVFLLGEFRPTWLALVAGILGWGAVVFRGMPSMNRARFGTPYIGREWMEGESGEVTSALDPMGTVRIHGSDWLARSADGDSEPRGSRIRVIGADRMVLEVESYAEADSDPDTDADSDSTGDV